MFHAKDEKIFSVPCVTKGSVSWDTCPQTNSGHFIHNVVFTEGVLMIPMKTASGVIDPRQSSVLLKKNPAMCLHTFLQLPCDIG